MLAPGAFSFHLKEWIETTPMNAYSGNAGKRKMDSMGRIGAEDSSVSFHPPEGLKLSGDSGEATVTWRRSDDGMVTIETFDGLSLRPAEDRETMEDDGMKMEMS